jgi:hypothetical protein
VELEKLKAYKLDEVRDWAINTVGLDVKNAEKLRQNNITGRLSCTDCTDT